MGQYELKYLPYENIGTVQASKLFTTGGPGSILNRRKDSFLVMDPSLWNNKDEIYIIDEPGLATYLGVRELRRPYAFMRGIGGDPTNAINAISATPFPRYHICKNPDCRHLFDVSEALKENKALDDLEVNWSEKTMTEIYATYHKRIMEHYQKKTPLFYRDLYYFAYKKKGTICPVCGSPGAYPAGYVVACENGHLQDFPWSDWVSEGKRIVTTRAGQPEKEQTEKKESCEHHRLYLKKYKESATQNETDFDNDIVYLEEVEGQDKEDNFSKEIDTYVVCEDCRRGQKLKYVMDYNKCKCGGRHPQIKPPLIDRGSGVDCKAKTSVLKKDSINVYFPVTRSTVSILPMFSEEDYKEMQYLDLVGVFEEDAGNDPETQMKKDWYGKINDLAEKLGNISEVYKPGVREIEYNVFTQHESFHEVLSGDSKKLNVVESEVEEDYKKYFSKVLRVRRMREIQAVIGFTRIHPADSEQERPVQMVPFKSGEEVKGENSWYPAVELKGEGIFLELNRKALNKWICKEGVSELSERYQYNYEAYCESNGWEATEERNAQYVLLHTFTHFLIKELSLHSGYTMSELKERIYSSEEMCGLLIYTTSPDVAGTLGGLEELGKWGRFKEIMHSALHKAMVCTADPQCYIKTPFDRTFRGLGGLNGAACHCCTILPDITCESRNQLLDRALVVSLPNKEGLAFFGEPNTDLTSEEA